MSKMSWRMGSEITMEPLNVIAPDNPVTYATYSRDISVLKGTGSMLFYLVSIRQHDFAGLTSIEIRFLKFVHPDQSLCSLYGRFSKTLLLIAVVENYVKRNTYYGINSAIPSCRGDITPVTALNTFP
jgi:hypothetical protein